MSRLTDLLRQVRQSDAQLAKDLEAEIGELTNRRTFGLVFEPHQPEAVELPSRPIRRGDKVRILVPRGETKAGDSRLWRVKRIERVDGQRLAHLIEIGADEAETKTLTTEDLVVVAESKDRIYPGLVETGRVQCGGDKPFHTVINAENFHALEMLTYTHRHSIDAVYIDPPYNTGAKDWKYNNDYVDREDDYRHSKWLAFMERRLRIARELLNPHDSVLIVAIDENEQPRLALLLDQIFPEARSTTVSVAINPKSTPENGFGRVDEYLIFLAFGDAKPATVFDAMLGPEPSADDVRVRWRGLSRSGANAVRSKSPGAYYPIFINKHNGHIHSSGEVPPDGDDGSDVAPPEGTVAVWPTPRPNGTHGRWSVIKETFDELHSMGAVKTGRVNFDKSEFPLSYLTDPMLKKIETGEIRVVGRDDQGAMVVEWSDAENKKASPRTMWHRTAHSASEHGTGLISKLLPGITFDYAKSLYAVEDALRLFIGNKPEAVVLDFFAGAGTTAHAVMRLNQQDGGRRQSISVTNNEVSVTEETQLRRNGFRPGDSEWERFGICDLITKPRVTAAITGMTPDGSLIDANYSFTDEFPMSDGLEENAAYFTLTYETPLAVRHHRAFERIAPMLWLRAGAHGRIITDLGDQGWDIAQAYAVLENFDQTEAFLTAIRQHSGCLTVYIITDDDPAFQMICRELPENLPAVQLYESYLHNFTINQGQPH